MKIKRFECNPLQENCYVVSDETGEAAIIDCGAYYAEEKQAIRQYVETEGLKPVVLLNTHGHFDHAFGNAYIYNVYGLKARIHADDAPLLAHLDQQCLHFMGTASGVENSPLGDALDDGDVLTFGNHSLRVLHTPGHSRGGCFFWCEAEQVAFSGDTLFRMSVGRTDFEEGDYDQLVESLGRVARLLPPSTTILPGHGPATSMADELKYNPYLR
jgi:glyoxylase-like metal-dependent hydrolase (beta-lactamase superfamily II)